MATLLFTVDDVMVKALAFSDTFNFIEEKLYQVYYQADRLWTGGKAI